MTVKLNDTDISQYVQGNSLVLTRAKSDVGQVLLNPIPSLVGIDVDDFWNKQNPVSVFFGANDLSDFEIKVFEDDQEIFNGFIQTIQRNENETANVGLQTELQKALKQNIIYSSAVNANPAEIFIEVCKLYKIKYDPVSTLRSSAIYNQNSVVCSSRVLTPNISFISFFDQLARIGCASIYSVGNYLYFKVYESGSIDYPVVTIENTQATDEYYILSEPIIASVQKDVITGYSVTYRDLNVSELDQTYNWGAQKNSFSLSGGQNNMIVIESTQAAVWLAEQWYSYLNRADSEIRMGIKTVLANDLQVGYPATLKMNDGTVDMNFIIHELVTQNRVLTSMRGVAYD